VLNDPVNLIDRDGLNPEYGTCHVEMVRSTVFNYTTIAVGMKCFWGRGRSIGSAGGGGVGGRSSSGRGSGVGSGNNQKRGSREFPELIDDYAAIANDAVNRAQELLGNEDCLQFITDLVRHGIGEAATDEIVEIFMGIFRGNLVGFQANVNVFTSVGSHYPTRGTTMGAYHMQNPNVLATVTESGIGNWVVFLNRSFFGFGISLDRQGSVMLHEAAHTLGEGFGDDDLAAMLRNYNGFRYDRGENSSVNLQNGFEQYCN
jgi:hypothetical protein